MKKLILILTITFALSNFANANNADLNNGNLLESVIENDVNCELMSLIEQGTITSISMEENSLDDCTLSAEVSYKGASMTISITADTCYEAGQGLAQSVKGFMDEVEQ